MPGSQEYSQSAEQTLSASDVDAVKIPRQLTFGEKAVGISFNPGSNPKVESIKRRFADLIDELEGYRNPQNAERHPEVSRMLSIAITECQSAQMWAVKSVTWQY